MTIARTATKERNMGSGTGQKYTLERDPRVAPQADLASAVVDREEKARKQAVADARRRDVGRPDIDVAEVGVGDLNVRRSRSGCGRGARKAERVGRRGIDTCRH